jgi:hypothetical protein
MISINDETGDWHKFQLPLRLALQANDRTAYEELLREAVYQDHVVFDWDRGLIYEANAEGRSFNAMSQSTLGRSLIDGGARFDEPIWVEAGKMVLDTMLVEWAEGGLGLLDRDAMTAWFTGMTTSSVSITGGTLNKHLYATRTFLQAAQTLEGIGRQEDAARYVTAGEAGLRKLVTGEHGPLLSDYFVRTPDGGHHLEAWVYYALLGTDPDEAYYLIRPQLNSHYHIFDMRLIEQAGYRLAEDFDWSPFYEPTIEGLTPFGAMLRVYENKIALGGLDVDTPTEFGEFAATPTGTPWESLPQHTIDWFEQFLYGPPQRGGAGADSLTGTTLEDVIEGMGGDDRLAGGAGADRLDGGAGNDWLEGNLHDDDIRGGEGSDTLIGGSGDDRLTGGAGADVFALLRLSGVDAVADWTQGDRIAIDDRFLGGAAAIEVRALDPAAFGPPGGGARILYDAATGALAVDADGAGGADPRLIAVLEARPELDAGDILLF